MSQYASIWSQVTSSLKFADRLHYAVHGSVTVCAFFSAEPQRSWDAHARSRQPGLRAPARDTNYRWQMGETTRRCLALVSLTVNE